MLVKCMIFAVRTAMLAMIAWHQMLADRETRVPLPKSRRNHAKTGD